MKQRTSCQGKVVSVILRILLVFLAISPVASVNATVVVSIRYFKVTGSSHYHLFLYQDDGKLIRQLTRPENAQDVAPQFLKGGGIMFTRVSGTAKQLMVIGADGKGLRALDKAPENYRGWTTESIAAYQLPVEDNPPNPWTKTPEGRVCPVPGYKRELIATGADGPDWGGDSFLTLGLRDLESGQTTEWKMEDYGTFGSLALMGNTPFLLRPPLRVAFLWCHRGSSDGAFFGAVDLAGKRIVELSPNYGVAIPHGSRIGFFVLSRELYQPLGYGDKTVNCFYLDWWDKDLKRTRFASGISLFGGAGVRVKGQEDLVIPYDPIQSTGR